MFKEYMYIKHKKKDYTSFVFTYRSYIAKIYIVKNRRYMLKCDNLSKILL